jgi:hypothetical protein
MEVDTVVENISFDVDGSDLVLVIDNTKRWRLSSAPTVFLESSADNDTDTTISSESLPTVFVPVHDDMQQSRSPDLSPYRCDWKNSWVLDQQERQMLWIAPDWRSYFHGKRLSSHLPLEG